MAIHSETIVVIPTMNRATLVIDALDAILNQTLQPDCLVIVDDGSTDNSLEVIRDWKTRTDPPFETKLIALPYNMGVSVARNIGFAQVRSHHRYVYFLDSDDIPPPHFLQHTTAALNQRPDAVATTANMVVIVNERLPRYRNEKASSFLIHVSISIVSIQRCLLRGGAGILSSTLFRSDTVRQLGGFNETRLTGQDGEFCFRLNLGDWLFVSTCTVTYRKHKLHLHQTQRASFRQRTHAYEVFLNSSAQADHECHAMGRRMLALNWRQAGLQLLAKQNLREAKDCFRRALSWSAFDDKKSLVYLTFVLSFGWLLKILGKFGLYEQFVNSVKQILYRFKTRL